MPTDCYRWFARSASRQPIRSARPLSSICIIRNGRIIDGTGSPWYSGDIGRSRRPDRRDRFPGRRARKPDDRCGGHGGGSGLHRMLGQSDLSILVNPQLPSKIFQGITTEITRRGRKRRRRSMRRIIAADRLGYDYLKIDPGLAHLRASTSRRLERQKIGINVAHYVGATQVRRMVLGDEDRDPDRRRSSTRMRELVAASNARRSGGSLDITPVSASALRRDGRAHRAGGGGIADAAACTPRTCDLRADEIIPALEEAIRIGREARIPVEIWHLKVAGRGTGAAWARWSRR